MRTHLALIASQCFLWSTASTVAASDWPQYRGPNHDAVSADRITTNWNGNVTNPVWRVAITNSLSSFSVSGGRAVTLATRTRSDGPQEFCLALDAADGRELWATPVDRGYWPQYPDGYVGLDDGPRPTPAIVDGSVYVLTSFLKVLRLNATNGAIEWQVDFPADFGGTLIRYQNAASPLIDSGLLYVNGNTPENSLFALSTSNGSVVWRSQKEVLTHSTPVIASLHGVRQLIFATAGGLIALDPATGARLWNLKYPFTFNPRYSVAVSPVVYEDMVFVGGSRIDNYGSVTAQVTFTSGSWHAAALWFTNDPSTTLTTPVVRDGYLYGMFGWDKPQDSLRCVHMRTGTVKWAVPGFGRGGIALVDGKLLVLTENNMLVLAEANSEQYKELGRFQALGVYNSTTNKSWKVPAIADGRAYLRSTSFGAAYDLGKPAPARLVLDLSTPAPNALDLSIRTVDGSPIDPTRASTIELRRGTDLLLPAHLWPKLTNVPFFDAGMLRITNLEAAEAWEFFITREQE